MVITHGNGPQVGFILLRSEMAKEVLHQVPLDTCGADTQGAIGYQIAQTLGNELRRDGVDRQVVAVVTQVVVDSTDPGFAEPTKPIGPFYTEEAARKHQESGWIMREDAGRGWRRVVASPRPLEIVEERAIRALLDDGVIVVAVGGGGIPVIRREDGNLEGIGAVIDKDWASCLLAKNLGADIFIVSTAVDKVAINFGTPEQRDLDEITVAEAKRVHRRRALRAGQHEAQDRGGDRLSRERRQAGHHHPAASARGRSARQDRHSHRSVTWRDNARWTT